MPALDKLTVPEGFYNLLNAIPGNMESYVLTVHTSYLHFKRDQNGRMTSPKPWNKSTFEMIRETRLSTFSLLSNAELIG